MALACGSKQLRSQRPLLPPKLSREHCILTACQLQAATSSGMAGIGQPRLRAGGEYFSCTSRHCCPQCTFAVPSNSAVRQPHPTHLHVHQLHRSGGEWQTACEHAPLLAAACSAGALCHPGNCSKLGCIAVPLPSHVGPLCLRPPPGLSPSQKGSGKLGYEAEAFAIYDTMRYIKPPVATVCVGSAFGEAAMLLAAGEPGRRAALPSTSIMIRQPMQRFTQMQARRGGQPLCLSTYCGNC